jgi:hypothetical protein
MTLQTWFRFINIFIFAHVFGIFRIIGQINLTKSENNTFSRKYENETFYDNSEEIHIAK